jgi:hypothetical protein
MPNFDLFINVIKRPESILYRSRVSPSSVNVSYVGALPLSSDNNISIQDTSGSLSPNRVIETTRVYNNEDTLIQETGSFYLTDVFSVATRSAPAKPLFFQHKFKQFEAGDKVSKVKIFDDLFNEVTTTEMLIKDTEGVMFSNLESYYNVIPDQRSDPEGIEYIFYYVTYNITKPSGATTLHRELLDNKAVFREATYEDIDLDTMSLPLDSKAYLVEETSSSFILKIASPRNVALKSKENTRLKLLHPTSKNYTDPWNLRVSNGRFFYGTKLYRIATNQFNSQAFFPQIGIKKVAKETPTVVNKNIIKLDYEDMLDDASDDFHLYLKITKGGTTHKFTTDPTYIGSEGYTNWSSTTNYGIKSVDSKTGFVEIDGLDLETTDIIEASYFYNENYYDFTSIDLNPIRNESILNKRIAIYIDPNDSSVSLKHKIFNVDGTQVNGGNDISTFISNETTATGTGNLFVLGFVTVGEGSGIKDLTIIDTRLDGGGIKKSYVAEVEDAYPEYGSFIGNGLWDGRPFPGNLNYLIKIPAQGVIKDLDGRVQVKEIKSILNNHTAVGVYPITKLYGPEIKFISANIAKNNATTANVTIEWKAVDDTTYRLYHKLKESSTWTLGQTYTHPASPTNKVVSISKQVTLDSNKEYDFTVIGLLDIDGTPTEVFTQHVSSTDTTMQSLADNPDSLNIIKVKVPNL